MLRNRHRPSWQEYQRPIGRNGQWNTLGASHRVLSAAIIFVRRNVDRSNLVTTRLSTKMSLELIRKVAGSNLQCIIRNVLGTICEMVAYFNIFQKSNMLHQTCRSRWGRLAALWFQFCHRSASYRRFRARTWQVSQRDSHHRKRQAPARKAARHKTNQDCGNWWSLRRTWHRQTFWSVI